MKSWDCFDTLIARRFYRPDSVFEEVGRRLNIDNFSTKRKQAELLSDKTYLGIYKHLPGIDPEVELAVEFEHCFPIVANMEKVKDGDIIVSDMYLDSDMVHKLLQHCGLNKDVKVVSTWGGKHHGWIWTKLPRPELHTGDNQHSDVVSPAAFGIKSKLYTECHFSNIESAVLEYDFQLACWMRYVRLQCPYSMHPHKNFWFDQANYNVPVLALATLELPDRDIAFTFRDCIHWMALYKAMTGKQGTRFDASRACYYNPSEHFSNQVFKQTAGKLIVDIQGSGNSPKQFFKDQQFEVLYITGPSPNALYKFAHDAIERHNCAPFGSLVGWNEDGPVRVPCEHSPLLTTIQSQAIKAACASAAWFTPTKNVSLMSRLIATMTSNFTTKNAKHVRDHI